MLSGGVGGVRNQRDVLHQQEHHQPTGRSHPDQLRLGHLEGGSSPPSPLGPDLATDEDAVLFTVLPLFPGSFIFPLSLSLFLGRAGEPWHSPCRSGSVGIGPGFRRFNIARLLQFTLFLSVYVVSFYSFSSDDALARLLR